MSKIFESIVKGLTEILNYEESGEMKSFEDAYGTSGKILLQTIGELLKEKESLEEENKTLKEKNETLENELEVIREEAKKNYFKKIEEEEKTTTLMNINTDSREELSKAQEKIKSLEKEVSDLETKLNYYYMLSGNADDEFITD